MTNRRRSMISPPTPRQQPAARRGFSLVEMLIALGITAALLTATFVALHASFVAYQRTTQVASTHTIARLTMHRILTLIRTGSDFGPHPTSIAQTAIVESDFIEFFSSSGELMRLEYVADDNALYLVRYDESNNEISSLLLEGVTQDDGNGGTISPFTLEFHKGTQLYRATIDLTLIPDDNQSVDLDGANTDVLRLVASAMPRNRAYRFEN